jgi:hypothetical protein
MLKTYTDYIDRYLSKPGLGQRPCPGEHHFVSSYLIPRLYALNQRVPDYINPDGMKGIIGDVVYYNDQEHQLGIEVKLKKIRLTKREFNAWVVAADSSRWPHTFIGIGTKGIGICSWSNFRQAYIESVQERDDGWQPVDIQKGYGPGKEVNVLLPKLGPDRHFNKGSSPEESMALELSFMSALKSEIDC